MELFTLPGIMDAVHKLVDMGAIGDEIVDAENPEYARGAIELASELFFRGGDPGSGERENILRALAENDVKL